MSWYNWWTLGRPKLVGGWVNGECPKVNIIASNWHWAQPRRNMECSERLFHFCVLLSSIFEDDNGRVFYNESKSTELNGWMSKNFSPTIWLQAIGTRHFSLISLQAIGIGRGPSRSVYGRSLDKWLGLLQMFVSQTLRWWWKLCFLYLNYNFYLHWLSNHFVTS